MQDLIERLKPITPWNSFAADLVRQSASRGLTQRQIDAAEGMLAKMNGRDQKSGDVNLSPILDMFETAQDNGVGRPKYFADGLMLKAANVRRVLWVTLIDNDVYQGKVVGGRFEARSDAEPTTIDALRRIAEDPLQAALDYGKATGICSCCGRKLTNKLSIELGIGPICRAQWGL
jgi:hypothetical protein